ncbi:MAG: LAGLIDADG family homing endonuclease [Candidatus Kariarchaeaceae archaeon]|jgi:intein/homing endonuclease
MDIQSYFDYDYDSNNSQKVGIIDREKTIVRKQFVRADWRMIYEHLKKKGLSLRKISEAINTHYNHQLYKDQGMNLESFRKLQQLVGLKIDYSIIEYKRYQDVQLIKSKSMAEMVGVSLGDGHLNETRIVYALNRVDEPEYVAYVEKLVESNFNRVPKRYSFKKSKGIHLTITSVGLVKALEELGLVKGDKIRNQVDVPQWIKENKEYRVACAKGLLDTDGSVYFHKERKTRRKYVYIGFSNGSIPLLNFLADFCGEYGIKYSRKDKMSRNRNAIILSSRKSVIEFAKIVDTEKMKQFLKKNRLNKEDLGNGIPFTKKDREDMKIRSNK